MKAVINEQEQALDFVVESVIDTLLDLVSTELKQNIDQNIKFYIHKDGIIFAMLAYSYDSQDWSWL